MMWPFKRKTNLGLGVFNSKLYVNHSLTKRYTTELWAMYAENIVSVMIHDSDKIDVVEFSNFWYKSKRNQLLTSAKSFKKRSIGREYRNFMMIALRQVNSEIKAKIKKPL